MSNDLHRTESHQAAAPAGEVVFLHCMWRTGSTFVFGRFRANERYRCFYEPLNESLAKLNERLIARYSGAPAARRLRHSAMNLPYFAEYRPFCRRWWRGVRGYRERFAFHDFFREHNEPLVQYLRVLLESAAAEGRQAMFKFCRSYGRLAALRRDFAGRHVYLFRNPRDQWQSYVGKGKRYFMAMTCVIAALRSETTPVLSALSGCPLSGTDRFSGLFGPISARRMFSLGMRCVRMLSPADLYRVFCHEWQEARAAGEQHCQDLIDVDRLSADSAYRRQIEQRYAVRLDGCQVKRYERYGLPLAQMREIEVEYGATQR